MAIFKKIVLSSRIGNFLAEDNRRTRIPRWLGREIVVVSSLPSMRGLGGKERNGKDGVMIWGGIVRDEEEWERWKMEGWE